MPSLLSTERTDKHTPSPPNHLWQMHTGCNGMNSAQMCSDTEILITGPSWQQGTSSHHGGRQGVVGGWGQSLGGNRERGPCMGEGLRAQAQPNSQGRNESWASPFNHEPSLPATPHLRSRHTSDGAGQGMGWSVLP
jgi:hypothetical protein